MPEDTGLASTLAEIAKRHNVRVGSLSDVVTAVVGQTTGNLAVDYVTGVAGIPMGRITELYGQPSSGKTTTALQAAAALQRDIVRQGRDEYILYLDFEHAIDGDYAAQLGLDTDHPSFLLVQPHWLEQGAEIALKLLATGKIRLSIFDSVAAMTPKALIDGEFDQRTNAMNRARLMSGLLQRLASLLHEQNCAAVFINHLMEAVEMSGRPGMPAKATTPGGKALKFYASLRLEYRQIGNAKAKLTDPLSGEQAISPTATHVKVVCTKNKVGVPFRTAEVRVSYGQGFDNAWSALQALTANKIIERASTGRHYFTGILAHEHMDLAADGRAYVRGENNVLAFADAHPDWRNQLVTAAVDLIALAGDDTLAGEPADPLADLQDIDLA